MILNFTVFAALLVCFSSCDGDDEGPSGSFTFDDESYKLSRGYVRLDDTDVSGDNTYYYWTAVLTSKGIQYDEVFTGKGDAVILNIVALNDDGVLPSGTYTSTNETADSNGVYIDFNVITEVGEVHTDVTDVSITITKSGSTHKISFTIELNSGETVTGSFSGKVTEIVD